MSIKLDECTSFHLPSIFRSPVAKPDKNGRMLDNPDDLAAILIQAMVANKKSVDFMAAMVKGFRDHWWKCSQENGDYGIAGLRGVLVRTETFERLTKDKKPYATKGRIVMLFDENATEEESIDTGILRFTGNWVPEDSVFDVVMSNTVMKEAQKNLGKAFYGHKVLIEAATKHAQHGKVRFVSDIAAYGDVLITVDGASSGTSSSTNSSSEAFDPSLFVESMADSEWDNFVTAVKETFDEPISEDAIFSLGEFVVRAAYEFLIDQEPTNSKEDVGFDLSYSDLEEVMASVITDDLDMDDLPDIMVNAVKELAE